MTTVQPDSTQIDNDRSLVTTSCIKGENAYDLSVAMNYGYAAGSPQLLRFITEHVEMIHNPPYRGWESCMTCSTTSAIDIVFRMLCNRGDWIIAEEYSYPGAIEAAKRMGLNVLSIAMDEMGLLPDDLDQKLSRWDDESRKPSVLYTIPSGQNPTGSTQPAGRRRALYEITERHDLLIVEDDPYYFIRLDSPSTGSVNGCLSDSNPDDYLARLPPSYLSLDTSGRVLRLDTTSKILAPGLRCGWMTGCSQLIAKFIAATELSTVAPSGPSQIMMYKLLDEAWGHTGFVDWLMNLSHRYGRRLDIMLSACKKHLPQSICKWTVPESGMFLWIQIDWSQHPMTHCIGHAKDPHSCRMLGIEERIYQASRSHGVLISKGSWFAASQPSTDKMFFRITFAAAPEADLLLAIEKFGEAIREEFSTGV